jgi:hypothetical protein
LSNYKIIPSRLSYQSAPSVDQEIPISLEQQSQLMIEYDRSSTISLAQVYDDERQACLIFRPTFKLTYLYANTYTGTTNYTPFQYNLYYTQPEVSMSSGTWKGLPQYYEFDFIRPNITDQHLDYKAKSAYTYNWTYYLSYGYENDYDKTLYFNLNNANLTWTASTGIPFIINNSQTDGNPLISFQCIAPHGLTSGEYVELSFFYNNTNLFQVYSLGNNQLNSSEYIFNVYDIGYTGKTFQNGVVGTFKRVTNPENIEETRSKYYIRKHKILTNLDDVVMTKAAFEKNVFSEIKKLEYSSITPNQVTRISQLTSSNAYNVTVNYDLDFTTLLDNQKRPISELFLTVINKGYSGYFNAPFNNIGLKQGWKFNLTQKVNSYWSSTNNLSNTTIPVSSYTRSDNGKTYTFYFNLDLKKDDIMDGDFCEWNDYEQMERVVSPYYQKIKYNQNVFQTTTTTDQNSPGFYYAPHNKMTLRVFSDYIETGDIQFIDQVPSFSYFSKSDQQFRWRDLYTFGFKDNLERGVDYPFFNSAQYPFTDTVFRLIPEGINFNSNLLGINYPIKPLIDGCE